MTTALQFLHVLSGLVVLAIALEKLEVICPLMCRLTRRQRITEAVKAATWIAVTIGAGGAVAAPVLLLVGVQSGPQPLMRLEHPTLSEVSVLVGFALLIARTRIKEGKP